MIVQPDSMADAPSQIPEQVRAFFGAGGRLAECGVAGTDGFVFENRPQQMAMAETIARAILRPEHLAVEAGTGVGKTFAYLVPLILLAMEQKRPVAVSTYSINLQEQLVFKDLPFLRHCLELDFKVALCKGRANYICLRRLERAHRAQGDLFNKAQERELARLRRWADETRDGSLADWTPDPPSSERFGGQLTEDEEDKQTPNAQRSTPNIQCLESDDGHQPACCSLSEGGTIDAGNPQSAIRNPQLERAPRALWRQVCSEHDNCLARKCPHYSRCFLMKARARAFAADLLVLNHHLFFSDLALREQGKGLLPAFDTLVLDEAHCLEDTASEHLGLRLTQGAFEHWLRRLHNPETGRGLLAVLKDGEITREALRMWEDIEHFFMEVRQWARLEENGGRRIVRAPLEFATLLGARQAAIARRVQRLAETVEDADLQAELNAVARRGLEMCAGLDMFLRQTAENHVYWVAGAGAHHRRVALSSAPITVAPILEKRLFEAYSSVIMTSAALSAGNAECRMKNAEERSQGSEAGGRQFTPEMRQSKIGNAARASSLGYFRDRIGAARCCELVVGSPFNYTRQMRVYIAGDMPDPNDKEAFVPAVSRAIRYFVGKTRGRAFALFTNAEMMKAVARDLEPFFAAEGIMPLVQGAGLSRHAMLERFRRANDGGAAAKQTSNIQHRTSNTEGRHSALRTPHSAIRNSAVLFGLDSFWMGVDVRGAALSNVIIVRLPFAVPDEPVIKARMERIKSRGGNPFMEYSLPEAILKFRQGVGRLIRTGTDEGMIAVLDSRIVSKWYGRIFLGAIPECPVEIVQTCQY